jgi:hypothetical protein
LTGSFLNILLTDRLHGIVLNAVGTINKSKADQPIVFESDLRKDDFVGKGPRKAVFGTKPKTSESFLTITAQIWFRCSGNRKTASTRRKLVREPLAITESIWQA